jgi:hypothetical protein
MAVVAEQGGEFVSELPIVVDYENAHVDPHFVSAITTSSESTRIPVGLNQFQ